LGLLGCKTFALHVRRVSGLRNCARDPLRPAATCWGVLYLARLLVRS